MPPSQVHNRRISRLKALRRLGYKDYDDYLRSPQWHRVKVSYRASDLPQKCMCGSEDVQLHHKTYERVGAELLTDLTPLCATCHAMVHVLERRGELGLDMSGFESFERAEAYRAAEQPRRDRVRAEFEEAHIKDRTRALLAHLRVLCRHELDGPAASRLLLDVDAVLDKHTNAA